MDIKILYKPLRKGRFFSESIDNPIYYPPTTRKNGENVSGINNQRMTTNQKAEGSSPPGRAKQKLLKHQWFQGLFILLEMGTFLVKI